MQWRLREIFERKEKQRRGKVGKAGWLMKDGRFLKNGYRWTDSLESKLSMKFISFWEHRANIKCVPESTRWSTRATLGQTTPYDIAKPCNLNGKCKKAVVRKKRLQFKLSSSNLTGLLPIPCVFISLTLCCPEYLVRELSSNIIETLEQSTYWGWTELEGDRDWTWVVIWITTNFIQIFSRSQKIELLLYTNNYQHSNSSIY